VGESQYSQIKDEELPQIRRAMKRAAETIKLDAMSSFKLTAIVVAKRHHVRFFAQPKDAMAGNGNCKPGTLVDTVVTSSTFRDFYLQSHNGIKGTARPAHYFMLENEMGLTEGQIHTFVSRLYFP
jgi:eukaryotic translation initiation factor 2C